MARWRRRRKPDDKVVTHPIFSYTLKKKTLKVRESSATKHGCSVEEILYAATHALVDVEENEDPPKRLLLASTLRVAYWNWWQRTCPRDT